MLDDRTFALLGDKAAQERITDRGELLPCPHCRGKAKVTARQKGFHGQNYQGNKKLSWWIYIKCNKCHARSKPIKTQPIKLYADNSHISEGCFYSTDWHLGIGRGVPIANEIFGPYVKAAISEWNRRAPILTETQIALLKIAEKPRKFREEDQ